MLDMENITHLLIWTIAITSDLHFGIRENSMPWLHKEDHTMRILNATDEHNIKVVISAGDLTDHGYDGRDPIFGCFPIKGQQDEVAGLVRDFIVPIDRSPDIDMLLLGEGNHDHYQLFPYFYKPVRKLIKKRHCCNSNGYYSVKYNKLHIICMGEYPKDLAFLRENLPQDKSAPVLIFFHFNICEGEPYSDWWSDKAKNAFYEVIREHNIQALVVGHFHRTSKNIWREIPVYNGAGNGIYLLKFNYDGILVNDIII